MAAEILEEVFCQFMELNCRAIDSRISLGSKSFKLLLAAGEVGIEQQSIDDTTGPVGFSGSFTKCFR
jgi:hypothetical protein